MCDKMFQLILILAVVSFIAWCSPNPPTPDDNYDLPEPRFQFGQGF